MGVGGYNLLSIGLGLVALGLGLVVLFRNKKEGDLFSLLLLASMALCGLSIAFQHRSTDIWVAKNDWSALMDTMNVSASASMTLLGATTFLNGFGLLLRFLHHRKKRG